ncbi:sce7726 family protein, partial [Staphylococcus pseudintermedius]|uniref:sce7726 family protein n=1 Tax=Staphylococcus pseudintermedius TaxID=283734 RepID=UPI002888A9A4
AEDEAIRILQWLITGEVAAGQSLAVELPFLNVQRKADIVVAGANRLSAIEIKGPRDNFKRLAQQLADYQTMFLDVSLAVPVKHLATARSLTPTAVGLILLSDQDVTWIRRQRIRSRLKAAEAASWLSSKDLAQLLGASTVRAGGLEEGRRKAAEIFSAKKITNIALERISSRINERFFAFQRELG